MHHLCHRRPSSRAHRLRRTVPSESLPYHAGCPFGGSGVAGLVAGKYLAGVPQWRPANVRLWRTPVEIYPSARSRHPSHYHCRVVASILIIRSYIILQSYFEQDLHDECWSQSWTVHQLPVLRLIHVNFDPNNSLSCPFATVRKTAPYPIASVSKEMCVETSKQHSQRLEDNTYEPSLPPGTLMAHMTMTMTMTLHGNHTSSIHRIDALSTAYDPTRSHSDRTPKPAAMKRKSHSRLS